MQGNYCLANDIFSLGVTLLELSCSLEVPANGKLWQELRSSVLPEAAMRSLSPELQSIIRSMMEPDPFRRPTVDQLLSNPKLKSLNYQRKCAELSKKCVSSAFMFRLIFYWWSDFRCEDSQMASRQSSAISFSSSFWFTSSSSLRKRRWPCQHQHEVMYKFVFRTMTRTAMMKAAARLRWTTAELAKSHKSTTTTTTRAT